MILPLAEHVIMRAMCGCVDNSAMKITSRDRAKAKPGSDFFFTNVYDLFTVISWKVMAT